MAYKKKSCKKSQVRNPETGRCIKRSTLKKLKSCKRGSKRNASTGRCNKIKKSKSKKSKSKTKPRRTAHRYLKKSVEEGDCRGRTKASCKERSNCSYRKYTGCIKKGIRKKKEEEEELSVETSLQYPQTNLPYPQIRKGEPNPLPNTTLPASYGKGMKGFFEIADGQM